MLEACKEYLNTLAEGETGWRETLQGGAPKHLRVGGNVLLENEMTLDRLKSLWQLSGGSGIITLSTPFSRG